MYDISLTHPAREQILFGARHLQTHKHQAAKMLLLANEEALHFLDLYLKCAQQ